MNEYPSIAYVCLEFGIQDSIKTYAGGLGILAGDTIKSAADLSLPFTGLSLLYKHGYFEQDVDEWGNQIVRDDEWDWASQLEFFMDKTTIMVGNQELVVTVWKKDIVGQNSTVPLYYMDLDHEENPEEFRKACGKLYTPDHWIRTLQQLVIGYGSLQIYEKINGKLPDVIHINESHASFAILHMLKNFSVEEVRQRFVFTTHTPVEAGHEKHPLDSIRHIVGDDLNLLDASVIDDGALNMTKCAIFYSKYTNAVSKKHKDVTLQMFPDSKVKSITNGVHTLTWIAPAMLEVFDKHLGDWRNESSNLRNVIAIPNEEIEAAHRTAKENLGKYVSERLNGQFNPDMFTIGFARRAAHYKRNDLIFRDADRLNAIANKFGGIQMVFSGKAHPNDEIGQGYIRRIVEMARNMTDNINVIYCPNYNIEISQLLVSGVDVWLNNPVVPLEASGTSGMKASMNGIPNLSTFDGWWQEGAFEGVTGWTIGNGKEGDFSFEELNEMYGKLEYNILPLFYHDKDKWTEIMKSSIALNGAYFNSKRMMEEYVLKAYLG